MNALKDNELFKRIMNYDRQNLYGCCGDFVTISQTSILQNRDELSFFDANEDVKTPTIIFENALLCRSIICDYQNFNYEKE